MASSNSPQNQDPQPETQPKIEQILENPQEKEPVFGEVPEESNEDGNDNGGEEEEEGECGFCLFMKGGGCKETFIEWEKCIEEGEKNKEDIVEKCFQVTSNLKKCMEAHSDYYAPILQAEKAAEEEAAKELEKESGGGVSSNKGGDQESNSESESKSVKKEEALDAAEEKEGS